MNQYRFSTEFPSPATPEVPSYFKKEAIASLPPDGIAYPYAYAFKYDKDTGGLFINTKTDLDEESTQPTSGMNLRGAVLRLFGAVDNEGEVDGYVADLRRLKPGTIDSTTLTTSEDADPTDRAFITDQRKDVEPLLAAVFADPDGNPHFVGDERFKSHVEYLMDQADTLQQEYDNRYTTKEAEKTPGAPEPPTPGPENYLG